MSETWTADQHYARGMVDALGQTYAYVLRYGMDDLGDWLKRRERGYLALLPTDEHGNAQFRPTHPAPTSTTQGAARVAPDAAAGEGEGRG